MSDNVTKERFRDYLVCYKDTDEAEAVCGECGRPVCGPEIDASILGIATSAVGDHGHARRFRDSTFHHYQSGLGRTVLALGLLLLSVLLTAVFPRLIPGIVSVIFPRPIQLKPAIIQSAAILGVVLLATLRYQGGERTTNFRIRVRRTAKRILCDDCFEDRLVQLTVFYLVTVVAIIVVLVGIRNIVNQASALPLRVIALGLSLGILRDDIVALVVGLLKIGSQPDTR